MKILPVVAKGVQVGFSIEAENIPEQQLINILTSKGDIWKGWQVEPGKLMVYPDPTQMAGVTVH